MSKITLYIAPFGLESPFDFIPPEPYQHLYLKGINSKLNKLVKELQDAWKSQSNLPNAQYFPADLRWILFCPQRMTFLCRENYNQAFMARYEGGTYIVVPEILAHKSDFLARMRGLIPSQVTNVTYEEALKVNRRGCPQCSTRTSDSTCVPCSRSTQKLFHTMGVHNPGVYPNMYHLAIWIPGTTLPWDVLLQVRNSHDLTSYIPYAFKSALTAATSTNSEQHMSNKLLSLGFYPTEENWMLIDFHTGSQIHKSCISDLQISEGSSCTYIVGSVQCAPLVKKMLAVIKEHGAPGWTGFWDDLVSTQTPRAEHVEEVPVWTPATSVASSEYDYETA
ncbi:hypothetical protein EV426DRAFT_599182 [Tirmania nivea]|nr:hypothetical protein EV426DRAFT_599182 [Tirmania nivea]